MQNPCNFVLHFRDPHFPFLAFSAARKFNSFLQFTPVLILHSNSQTSKSFVICSFNERINETSALLSKIVLFILIFNITWLRVPYAVRAKDSRQKPADHSSRRWAFTTQRRRRRGVVAKGVIHLCRVEGYIVRSIWQVTPCSSETEFQ